MTTKHGEDPQASRESRDAFFEIHSLTRSIGVLKLFSTERTRLTFVQITQGAGLPRGTAHRVLRTLKKHGFLSFDDASKSYLLGPAFIRLAQVVKGQAHIAALLHSDLEELAQASGQRVGLIVESERAHGVEIDGVEAVGLLRFDVPGGPKLNSLAFSPCKIFAADKSEEEISRLLNDFLGPRLTDYTIADTVQMKATLQAVRRDGVAFDLQESSTRLCSIAAPVRDSSGHLVAAVVLLSMAERFLPGVRPVWTELVKATGLAMSRRLGYSPA